jgi:RNA-splicing ligase RtcB
MPDGHWGYGFPIGGVAAMDAKTSVISPGGIGFDINCGMRLVVTQPTGPEVKPRLCELVDALFKRIPTGVGSTGFLSISRATFQDVITHGARWCVQQGYGWLDDLQHTEDGGLTERMPPRLARKRWRAAWIKSAPWAPATTIWKSRWCTRKRCSMPNWLSNSAS